jgi:NAD(P)H-flavin reductase/ferredoxin
MMLDFCEHDLDLPVQYSFHDLERDDPFMDRDRNLCLLCGRCWRICEKVHGKAAISITGRGRTAKLGTAFGKDYVDSGCVFCGACIDICPTGTLTDRYARWRGAPEGELASTCTVCPEDCPITVAVAGGRVVGTRMVALDRESRLCAVGRFAYPLIIGSPGRLTSPAVKEDDELVPVGWDEAVEAVGRKLGSYTDGRCVVVVGEGETRETRHMYERFAAEVMRGRVLRVPAGDVLEGPDSASLAEDVRSGKVGAVVVSGDYLTGEILGDVEYLVVIDFLPSSATEKADAVLPAAVLAEVEGTFRTSVGDVKELGGPVPAPGEARAEWAIIRDLAEAMGASGFAHESVGDVTAEVSGDDAPAAVAGSPRDNLRDVPTRFRGHWVADAARALEDIGLPSSPEPPPAMVTGGFPVVEAREVVPNFHLVRIRAPAVAKYAKPGQFAIVMVSETSERSPYTLIDWDAEEGTISLVVEEVGRSSRELVMARAGDVVAHVSGPLGTPFPVEKVGTVALGGGCYGVAAIYPVARAMKEAGNRVVCAIEASTRHLLYMEDELRGVCDELLIATKDGSRGRKGGVQELFVELLGEQSPPDLLVAIGCTFMMRMVAEATESRGAPLQVALKSIMVDGTGMCGACRVTIGGETKFACVDGPFFDGHAVDWDELMSRLGAFHQQEVDALRQSATRSSGGQASDHECKIGLDRR